MYAKIENGQVTETVDDIRERFSDTSFPETLPDSFDGFVKVTGSPSIPDFNEIASTSVIVSNGSPVFSYTYSLISGEKERYLAEYRYEKVNGGVVVSGVSVQTDTEARANILGAKELNTSINWKTSSGFVSLTAQQISAIATAIGQHVQKCFDAENTVLSNIGNYSTKAAIEDAFDVAYSN